MKITLDIEQLLSEGRITEDEFSRFKQFAAEATTSVALNIILAFGMIAVAGGTIAFFTRPLLHAFLGSLLPLSGVIYVLPVYAGHF